MRDEKLYTVGWTQEYLNWYNYVDTVAEAMVESSEMREAQEVIARIMAK